MPRSKNEKKSVPNLTGELTDIIENEESNVNVMTEENVVNAKPLDTYRKQQIEEYKKESNKSSLDILLRGMKETHNWVKLSVIGLGAVGQALLIVENSLIATYILAGTTCLIPVMLDFKDNYKLVSNEIVKKKEVKGWWSKVKEASKFIWPGYAALGVGAGTMVFYVMMNENGYELVSNIALSVGTFVSGSAQMYVNPSVRRTIAKRNLEKLQSANIENSVLLELLEEKIDIEDIEQNIIKAQNFSKEKLEDLNNVSLKDVPKKMEEFKDEIDKANENSQTNLELLKQALIIKNIENKNLRKKEETSVISIQELESKILKFEDEIKALNDKLESKETKEEKQETHVTKYNLSRSSEINKSV